MRSRALAVALSLLAGVAFGGEREVRARDERPAQHVILTAHDSLSESDRAELAAKGILIQRPTTGGRYLARVPAGATDARIAAVEPLTEETKLHPSALREVGRGHAWANVNIYFHEDVAFDDARTSVLAAGGALDDLFATEFAPMHLVTAKIAPQSLAALVADDSVLMISANRHLQLETHNAISAGLSKVDVVQAAPYGLTGAGVAVSLFELAEGQQSHLEFGGRLTVLATGGSSSDKTHATHVAGTIAASGMRADAKGMAPKATLTQYKVELGGNGQPLYHTAKSQLGTQGIVVDNNSWGFILAWGNTAGYPLWNETDIYFGSYDYEYTAPLDDMSIATGVLYVHSAGNEGDGQALGSDGEHRHVNAEGEAISDKLYCYSKNGSGTDCPATPCSPGPEFCEIVRHQSNLPYDTLSMPGAAKNAITVGAVDTSRKALFLSSGGPAKDGRVKPEVVARGLQVLSSAPTNSYTVLSGTSMAAPVVTGIAALLAEQWRKQLGVTPKPEELKAVLIAGTDEIGAAGPDYVYGFGLVNAKKSVDLVRSDRLNRVSIAAKDEVSEFPIAVETPQTVRVVLQWPDPAIILPANQTHTASALVNDLDLEVVTGSGTLLPYVLDKTHPNANATTGVNRIDNTEVIDIPNAPVGTYLVRVKGGTITKGPQTAAVVTSVRRARACSDVHEPNDSAAAAFGNILPNQTVYGGFCASGDSDFYKFEATASGPIRIEVSAGDTPLTVSLEGVTATPVTVAPYTTQTLTTASVTASPAAPLRVTMRVVPAGTTGREPDYRLTPQFGQYAGPRRRAARK